MTAPHGGHRLVGCKSQFILRYSLWEVQELLFLSWKDFSSTAQTHLVMECVVKQGVGAHYTCVHFFPLFCFLHHKLFNLQVKLKKIWAWEGKQTSEIPLKPFRLRGMSEKGEERCKSWGSLCFNALQNRQCLWRTLSFVNVPLTWSNFVLKMYFSSFSFPGWFCLVFFLSPNS